MPTAAGVRVERACLRSCHKVMQYFDDVAKEVLVFDKAVSFQRPQVGLPDLLFEKRRRIDLGFGRQVAEGASMMAPQFGIRAARFEPGEFPPSRLPREWDLFSAGVFEQDADLVAKSLRLPDPRAGRAQWPLASVSSLRPSTTLRGCSA